MRETHEFKTTDGHTLTVRNYLTGGEARAISGVFLEGVEVGLGQDGKPNISGVRADLASKAQDKAIEALVESVDGVKEGIVQAVLDLPEKDFSEVISHLDSIQKGLDEKKSQK